MPEGRSARTSQPVRQAGGSSVPDGEMRTALRPKSARESLRTVASAARLESTRGRPPALRRIGHELAFDPRAVAAQRRAQHRGLAGDVRHVQRPVTEEVAEAVGDHTSAIPLDAAENVWAVADHEVGPGTHDGVGERDDVATRLAEEPLRPGPHVLLVGSFGTRVHRHDDDVRLAICVSNELHRGLDVEQVLCPGVRREADERDLRPAFP